MSQLVVGTDYEQAWQLYGTRTMLRLRVQQPLKYTSYPYRG